MKTNKEKEKTRQKEEKIFLVLIYANWLGYSKKIKDYFLLNEDNLIDVFIPLEIEEIVDLDTKQIIKENLYPKNSIVNDFILNKIKEINSIPILILFKEKRNKISNGKIIIPIGSIEQIKNKIESFI